MIGERRVLSTIIHLGSIVDDSKNYPIDFAPSKIEGRRKEKIRKKREREREIYLCSWKLDSQNIEFPSGRLFLLNRGMREVASNKEGDSFHLDFSPSRARFPISSPSLSPSFFFSLSRE